MSRDLFAILSWKYNATPLLFFSLYYKTIHHVTDT